MINFDKYFSENYGEQMLHPYSIIDFEVIVEPEDLREAKRNGELDCDDEYIDCYELAINCYANSFEAVFDDAWEGMIAIASVNGWVSVRTVEDVLVEYTERDEEALIKALDYIAPYGVMDFYSATSMDDILSEIDDVFYKAYYGELEEDEDDEEDDEDERW